MYYLEQVEEPRCKEDMFWIIGHRGCGENVLRRTCGAHQKAVPGIRENTLASFTQAAAHGADMIEFDVQVTADNVAVIFHDDYLVHGSLCAAERSLVRQLTAQQFGKLGPNGSEPLLRWFRDSETHERLCWDMNWECDIEDRMPTLEDVFNGTPKHLGFNIEIKMATSPALAVTPQEEIDRMLDAILPVVERCQNGRQIAFSSFDPDMISQLSKRLAGGPGRQRHSFWFLTTGKGWHADPRRTSIMAAVHFARMHDLDGVVIESGALRKEPEAVQLATSYGLAVMSYGVENGDDAWVLEQRALGVQGVIVDDVPRAVSLATVDKENLAVCYA